MLNRQLAIMLLVWAAWPLSQAAAVPSWTPPASVSFPGTGSTLAFADGGVEFILRIDVTMPIDIHNVSTRLVVSRKAPGGDWVEDISIPSTSTAVPAGGTLAVAPNGAAVVAFPEGTSNDFSPTPPFRWRAIYRSSSGVWEAPVTLFTDMIAPPAISNFDTPICAIAANGIAVAGASHPEDPATDPTPGQPDARLELATHPANGSWQPAQQLSAHDQSVESTAIGVDDAGNFTVAWSSRYFEGAMSADNRHTILVRRLLTGLPVWNMAEDVVGAAPSNDAFLNPSGFAVGPDGRAVIAFQYSPDFNMWAVSRPSANGLWTAPQALTMAGHTAGPLGAGVAPDGTSYLLHWFQATVSSQDYVGALRLPAGGAWSASVPISPLNIFSLSGGVAFRGSDALFVWDGIIGYADPGATPVVEASRWAAGVPAPEAFSDLEVYPATSDPRPPRADVSQVIADRAGSVVAIWSRGGDRHLSAYDGGGPVLTASSIPSSVTVGVPAHFGVTFSDLWSAVVPPTWTFGDGTPAAGGTAVDHTFGATGTYMISVNTTDALGNPAPAATFSVEVHEVHTAPRVQASDCETLAAVPSLHCRCMSGLTIGACTGQSLPRPVVKRFTAACGAVNAADVAGRGKKGRKAATRAVQGFKAARGLASKRGHALSRACRDALSAVLGSARDHAAALKSTF